MDRARGATGRISKGCSSGSRKGNQLAAVPTDARGGGWEASIAIRAGPFFLLSLFQSCLVSHGLEKSRERVLDSRSVFLGRCVVCVGRSHEEG